ncbi:MAG: hypothetical protein AAF734_03625 [Bacteroidota bacterium]
MHRKKFLKSTLSTLALASVSPQSLLAKAPVAPDPLDPMLVKEFVIAGHGKLDQVKEMLQTHPTLLYARYDWGKGDFEEAIEGAGHLGNKEIAHYLIEQGARVNVFVLTMLGKTDLVKGLLEAYPTLLQARGAHGFTLLHHARVGKATILEQYLLKKGLKETKIDIK